MLKSQKGIALLIVIWVLTILMAAVLSFSFLVRTEAHSTLSFKEGMEEKFLAEAGIERGVMELLYRKQNLLSSLETGIWRIDGTPNPVTIGDGTCTVKIIDESGKLDINTVPDLLLKNFLLNLGINDKEADTIVDSIMDWKDPDDLTRLHGAESDYYMSLPAPYKAKNADFDTLEELLLVKGVTPEILYGTAERKGMIDFLTVNTKNNRINLNSAPKEVLTALPGMTAAIADSILEFRKSGEIRNIQDIQPILGESFGIMSQYLSAADSNVFTIDAVGRKGGGKGGYAVRATIMLDPNSGRFIYLYYKSPAIAKQ